MQRVVLVQTAWCLKFFNHKYNHKYWLHTSKKSVALSVTEYNGHVQENYWMVVLNSDYQCHVYTSTITKKCMKKQYQHRIVCFRRMGRDCDIAQCMTWWCPQEWAWQSWCIMTLQRSMSWRNSSPPSIRRLSTICTECVCVCVCVCVCERERERVCM